MRSFLVVAVLAAFLPLPAFGEIVCGSRASIVDYLARNFSKALVGIGISDDGYLLERLESPAGDWTVLLTRPSEKGPVSCVFTSGSDWQAVPPVKGEKP